METDTASCVHTFGVELANATRARTCVKTMVHKLSHQFFYEYDYPLPKFRRVGFLLVATAATAAPIADDVAADDVIAATALADAGDVVVVAADVVVADRDAVAGAHEADVAALPLSVAHTRCTDARVHTRALLY